MFRTVYVALLSVPLAACPAPATALARAQDTAQEFNMNTRYGRNELALEHVATNARDEFAAHHRSWGTSIRLADVEVAGLHPTGDKEVEVIVRATWYRPEDEDLKATTLRQRWRDQGGWQLIAEQRIDGDVGLFGETVVHQVPEERRAPATFPTIRLGESK